MIERDVIIVGGGPAGSSAAWELTRRGVDCLVLDRETFPREKLCAGWITPEVVSDLEFEPAAYPHRFLTFDVLNIHVKGLKVPMRSPQHSIRRFEFDRWLLERSGAEVRQHNVKHVEADGDGYRIDDQFRCRYLIGAGGTRCPVYRDLFRASQPRPKALQAVTLELEFPFAWRDPACHLWFLTDGLPGYAWYVPKAEGYLNVGVGGMAEKLKAVTTRSVAIGTGWSAGCSLRGSSTRRRSDPVATVISCGAAPSVGGSAMRSSRAMRQGSPPAISAKALARRCAVGCGPRGRYSTVGPTTSPTSAVTPQVTAGCGRGSSTCIFTESALPEVADDRAHC
jgi:flavin-dependent dehydrogenase